MGIPSWIVQPCAERSRDRHIFLDAPPQPPLREQPWCTLPSHWRPQLFCLDRLVSKFELAHKRLITDTSLSLTAVFFPSPRALVKGRRRRKKKKGGKNRWRETGLSVNSSRCPLQDPRETLTHPYATPKNQTTSLINLFILPLKAGSGSRAKITSYNKARNFSKLQGLPSSEKPAWDPEFATRIPTAGDWLEGKSAPGMCVLRLGALIKSGSCQLCKLRGRGAFSDFLREGSFCAGELLPLVDPQPPHSRSHFAGTKDAGIGKPSREKWTSGCSAFISWEQDSSCASLGLYFSHLVTLPICFSYQCPVDVASMDSYL